MEYMGFMEFFPMKPRVVVYISCIKYIYIYIYIYMYLFTIYIYIYIYIYVCMYIYMLYFLVICSIYHRNLSRLII